MRFVLFVLLLAAPAYSQTVQAQADAGLLTELRELEKKLGQELFKPLPVSSYIGISKVELKGKSIRTAMDLGVLRAQSYLISEICDPERKMSEVKVFLVGQTVNEYMKIGEVLWTRISMSKEFVDGRVQFICFNSSGGR